MNSSRFYLEKLVLDAANATPAGAMVLDAGAGDCCYRTHFQHAQYEAADFAQANKHYGELTYVCDLTAIPVPDARYDVILCTQVLAHLPKPDKALRELHRILKPNGKLYLTAPLFFEENEQPYDFWRFTQYGVRRLIGSEGFKVESLDWLEGYYGTVAYQLGMAARCLPTTPSAYGGGVVGMGGAMLAILARPVFALLSKCFSCLDRRHRWRESGMCKNYAIVASSISKDSCP